MNKLRTLGLVTLLVAFGGTATADTLNMQGASAAVDGHPTRGMTQQRVESKFGSPASVASPVGDPPITRWEYADFVVFFEYDKVIHAVAKR
ncbi:MAG: hypothetical protein K0U72_00305 [Gammaproteobacteria bacterium]|nr:hypothetical protein [Gammaproteobacteria bacterium]